MTDVFACVGVVGEGDGTVVGRAVRPPNGKPIASLNAGIGEPPEVDRSIAKGKNVAGWG